MPAIVLVMGKEGRLQQNEQKTILLQPLFAMIRKPEASVFRVRSNVRFVLAVEADDAARLFDVVVAGDGDEEQVELGNVLDQFDRRAVGQFAVEDDHVPGPSSRCPGC